jgi:putative SOS response-associated peptidase YedK
MCNSYKFKRSAAEVSDLFRRLDRPLRFPESVPNIEAKDVIRITDIAPIVRMGGEGAEMIQRPWSWKAPNGAPVFNFRSEGRHFPQFSRCAVPTDGFYEFTAAEAGSKLKARWLFTMPDEDLFFIAGHMRENAWAMLTTDPGPDIAPFHNRQVVVLSPQDAMVWLQGAVEGAVLRPALAGTLEPQRA